MDAVLDQAGGRVSRRAVDLQDATLVGRKAHGVQTRALVTAMDAPLGQAVGNSLEVIESVETLKGRGPADLEELSVLLAAHMLLLAGKAADLVLYDGDPFEHTTHVTHTIIAGRVVHDRAE